MVSLLSGWGDVDYAKRPDTPRLYRSRLSSLPIATQEGQVFASMQTLVRSATLNGYIGLARSLGLDPGEMLRAAGLDVPDLAVPEKWISAAAVARLLAASAAGSGHDDLALRLAERRRLSALGPLSVVLREEPDLREVLALLISYERSYNEALRMSLTEAEDLATLRLWFEFGEPAPPGQALALGLAVLHAIIGACLGPGWRPLSVCFSAHQPADIDAYRNLFGAGVRFGCEFTGIVFYSADLDRKNSLADPLMRPYAQQFLDTVIVARATTWADRARELIEFLLPLSRCSIGQVARALDVDQRTLQRHLAREGASFSAVLHAVRAEAAERYLSSDRYSMTQVSTALGFASPSAFSRWFTQQSGMSPSTWRQRSHLSKPSAAAVLGTDPGATIRSEESDLPARMDPPPA
jgi:AraC-like DNA-binding protein